MMPSKIWRSPLMLGRGACSGPKTSPMLTAVIPLGGRGCSLRSAGVLGAFLGGLVNPATFPPPSLPGLVSRTPASAHCENHCPQHQPYRASSRHFLFSLGRFSSASFVTHLLSSHLLTSGNSCSIFPTIPATMATLSGP